MGGGQISGGAPNFSVWHNQLPSCIIGFKKYLAVSEELGAPLEICTPTSTSTSSLCKLRTTRVQHGTSWKMTILNIRSLASLATINRCGHLHCCWMKHEGGSTAWYIMCVAGSWYFY